MKRKPTNTPNSQINREDISEEQLQNYLGYMFHQYEVTYRIITIISLVILWTAWILLKMFVDKTGMTLIDDIFLGVMSAFVVATYHYISLYKKSQTYLSVMVIGGKTSGFYTEISDAVDEAFKRP
jgi:hypothetical protein